MEAKTNQVGLSKKDYTGSPSTLCKGCGHDSITANLVTALYDLSVDPSEVIKVSGIGCSSKTPNYFMEQSFGFNSVHGRMASLATGVHLSQPKAKIIGISGDGDTASIGLGGFLHLIRRNVPMVYIIANNGVYGLTKGQFSATSDLDDLSKIKNIQHLPDLDMVLQSLTAGCGFVARTFSGDNVQLKNILKLALGFNGTAVIDVISPCVAYGNHVGFSKSYTKTQEINSPLHKIDLINDGAQISKEELKYKLIDLNNQNHDVKNLSLAIDLVLKEKSSKSLHTGLIYYNDERPNLNSANGYSEKDKFFIPKKDLRIDETKFANFNKKAEV
jgi:2-oxoglutarate ferredoxin oxidoreductase subunit beta